MQEPTTKQTCCFHQHSFVYRRHRTPVFDLSVKSFQSTLTCPVVSVIILNVFLTKNERGLYPVQAMRAHTFSYIMQFFQFENIITNFVLIVSRY